MADWELYPFVDASGVEYQVVFSADRVLIGTWICRKFYGVRSFYWRSMAMPVTSSRAPDWACELVEEECGGVAS